MMLYTIEPLITDLTGGMTFSILFNTLSESIPIVHWEHHC